jgi:hypothetical protein
MRSMMERRRSAAMPPISTGAAIAFFVSSITYFRSQEAVLNTYR